MAPYRTRGGARPACFSVTLAACLAAHAACAAAPPEATPPAPRARRLEEVLVSASRRPGAPLNAREYPGNVSVVTSEAIARSGAQDLPELLRRLDGVTTMDTNGFGLGADGSVNLRDVVNSARTGVLVLVDGVRQNRVTGDEVHWQGIPLAQVERIEVIRGGGGLGYGEGALSGVINIRTKRGGKRPIQIEQGAELGSFGQRGWHAAPSGRAGPFSYAGSFTQREVRGYRESTSSRTATTLAHLAWEPAANVRLATHVRHSEDTSYFSGGITPEASQARRIQTGSLPGFFDDASTEAAVEAEVTDVSGFGFAANAFWRGRETDSVTGDSRFATIAPSQGCSLRTSHAAESGELRHGFVLSLDLLDEKASVGTRGARLDESNKYSYGLWVEETLRLYDRVSLVAGLRFDKSRFVEDISFPAYIGTLRFEGSSPIAGITVDLTDETTLYGRYARPFKAPNVDDFSAVVPTNFVGNISLQPQQGEEYEVGLRLASEALGEGRLAWFYNRINKEILFNATAFQNQNFDTERIGVETRVEPRLPVPGLHGWLAYTFLEAEFRKGDFRDRTIPGVPEHVVTAGLEYEALPGLFWTLDWLLVQDFFRINDFNNRLPGDNYGVLNVGVRYERWGHTVFLRIDNVTSEEYTSFQSSNGTAITTGENPAPPISFLGGYRLRF